jgi:hypothetical protein
MSVSIKTFPVDQDSDTVKEADGTELGRFRDPLVNTGGDAVG